MHVRRRLVFLLALAAGFFIAGALCLRLASARQAELSQVAVNARIAQALLRPLQLDDAALLQSRTRELLGQAELGLDFLEVRDASGLMLVSSGSYDSLWLPLPEFVLRDVRSGLYGLSANLSQGAISDGGKVLGHYDFALSGGNMLREVPPEIQRLRGLGLTGLGLSTLLLSWLFVVHRRHVRLPGVISAKAHDAAALNNRAKLAVAPMREPMQRENGNDEPDLASLGLATLTIGRDATVTGMNALAAQLTGWTADDALGLPVYSVFRVLDEQAVLRLSAAEECLQSGRPSGQVPCLLRDRSGTELPIVMSAVPQRSRTGTVEGALMLFGDDRKQQADLDELRRQVRFSQAVVDHLHDGLVTTDRAGVIRSANARVLQLFGYSVQELEGFPVTKLLPVPFLNTPGVQLSDYISDDAGTVGDGGRRPRVVGWRKDASTLPLELRVQPLQSGTDSGLILILRDLRERLRSQGLAQRLGRLLDAAAEEVFVLDAQTLRVLEVNKGACRSLGWSAEQILAMNLQQLEAGQDPLVLRGGLDELRRGDKEQLVLQGAHRRADGSEYPVELRISYSPDEEPPVFMVIASDISERLHLEGDLKRQAQLDALTGLPNRRLLHQRIKEAIAIAASHGNRTAVLFVDMDRFKQINDTLGHEAGDLVLKTTAQRLAQAVRSSDTVARIGGDEFAVLAAEIRAEGDGERVAAKLLETFSVPIELPGGPQRVSPSIGIALYPDHGQDAESLLRAADAAMYQAKQAGRACYRSYRGA